MSESEYKFFEDVNKPKKNKKYEDMTKDEKEAFLRNKNKNADLSGFEDGGVAKKKKSYFEKIINVCKIKK